MTIENGEDLFDEQRANLDREWLLLSAFREGFTLGRRSTVTYREAISYSLQTAPALISSESLIVQGFASALPELYRAKAAALTQTTGETVTALQVAAAERTDLEVMVRVTTGGQRRTLLARVAEVERAMRDLDHSEWTESQAITFDAAIPASDFDVALPVTDRGQGYVEYRLRKDRSVRVRTLHPDPPEWKSGVDLIYESYWVTPQGEALVRIAALQYKMWNGRSLVLDQRTEDQLNRAHATFCGAGCCETRPGVAGLRYRMPHCAAFLRPTDRVQQRRGFRATKGWHLPVCIAGEIARPTRTGSHAIYEGDMKTRSVSQDVFEELFAREMLGSEWMPAGAQEEIYRRIGIMDTTDSAILYMQDYSPERMRAAGAG